jgi:hypothetical protein
MSSDANDKPARGRPRYLDDAKRREVCALISVGTSMTDAARYVGCNVVTIRREALCNEEFSAALQRAFLGAELSPLHEIRNAAKKHWRAGGWLLERTNPTRFSKRSADTMTLEEVEAVMNAIDDIIRREIPYEHLQQRVISRLEELGEHLHREVCLAYRDPCPPARRARKFARSLSRFTAAGGSQLAPDSHNEQ